MAPMELVESLPLLAAGTSEGLVELRRSANGTFVLVLVGGAEPKGENRFSTPFARALHRAFDAVEAALAEDRAGAPAALLAMSRSPKFFSNGIDPVWTAAPERTKVELAEWLALVMTSFARPLLLPIPTICAIGGHAFGAGIMFAMGFDYRFQARGRGFLCAVEVAIGMTIPEPELTLFRHDMPVNAFHETVLMARRWAADDAFRAGVIHQACDSDSLLADAFSYCEKQGKTLTKSRAALGKMKMLTKGYVAKEIFHYNASSIALARASLPEGLLQHADSFARDAVECVSVYPWALPSKL